MAGDCPYHDRALPQWCNECGGFMGWFCAICGDWVGYEGDATGWCCCLGGSPLAIDGPSPAVKMLQEIEARFEALGLFNSE